MTTNQIETAARIIDAIGWADHDRLKRAGSPPEVLEALTRGSLHTAAAVIAAIHPTVTTVEELDALPCETVIRDSTGFTYEEDIIDPTSPREWVRVGRRDPLRSDDIALPATVLHMGGAA